MQLSELRGSLLYLYEQSAQYLLGLMANFTTHLAKISGKRLRYVRRCLSDNSYSLNL